MSAQNKSIGVANTTTSCKYITFPYDANTVTQKIFTASQKCVVTDIRGATRVAGSGGACTFDFWKAASGVAVASGTKLNTTTFDIAGTADTNQVVSLVALPATVTLAVGDSIGVVLTGTPTSAVGAVTITLEPTS